MFSDTGAGIAAEVKEHLFEPLFTTKQSGSGLGLVIARDIIAEHRGQIELVSGFEASAVFRLTIPLTEYPTGEEEYIEVETDAA
jgi:signal transduction histidine kinase